MKFIFNQIEQQLKKRNKGGILLTVLIFLYFTIVLVLSGMSIFFGSLRNELLVKNHYAAQSMMLLTQHHLMQAETLLSSKMTLRFQQGMVQIEKVSEQTYQLNVILTNHYQEDKVVTIDKKKNEP